MLWGNPKPDSAFTAQTITLSSDDYDYLKIYYRIGNTRKTCDYVEALKGYGAELIMSTFSSSAAINGMRYLKYVNDTTFDVADYVSHGTVNQQYLIPVKIVGCKF